MPNLFERVAHNSLAGVSQTRIIPAQYHRDLGGEVLERAVDVTNVHDPDSDRDLSWSRLLRLRPLNQSGRFRAARELDRHRKKDKKRKMDSFHEIVAEPRCASLATVAERRGVFVSTVARCAAHSQRPNRTGARPK